VADGDGDGVTDGGGGDGVPAGGGDPEGGGDDAPEPAVPEEARRVSVINGRDGIGARGPRLFDDQVVIHSEKARGFYCYSSTDMAERDRDVRQFPECV
jgi:hypothetical protein